MKCPSCGKHYLEGMFDTCPFCGASKEPQEVAPTPVSAPVPPAETAPKPTAEQVVASEERQSPAALWEAANRNDAQGVVAALWPEVLADMPIDHQGKVGYLVGRFPEMSGDLVEEVAGILQGAEDLVGAVIEVNTQAPTIPTPALTVEPITTTAPVASATAVPVVLSVVEPTQGQPDTAGTWKCRWCGGMVSFSVDTCTHCGAGFMEEELVVQVVQAPVRARPLGQDALNALRGVLGKVHIRVDWAHWGAKVSVAMRQVSAKRLWGAFKAFSQTAADQRTPMLAAVLTLGAVLAAVLLARILVVPTFLALGIGILVFGRQGGFSKREIILGILFFMMGFLWLFFGRYLQNAVSVSAYVLRAPFIVYAAVALVLFVSDLIANRLQKQRLEVILSVLLALAFGMFLVGLFSTPTKIEMPTVTKPNVSVDWGLAASFLIGAAGVVAAVIFLRRKKLLAAIASLLAVVVILGGIGIGRALISQSAEPVAATPTRTASISSTPTATVKVTSTVNITATIESRVKATAGIVTDTPAPSATPTNTPTNTTTAAVTATVTQTVKPASPTTTKVAPTNTVVVPPTATNVPPPPKATDTPRPPEPPTNTPVPPTNTQAPRPTDTRVPPTNTHVPPTSTSVPPTNTVPPPTPTRRLPPPTKP